ncbi:hypothetical protein RUM43_006107 [Polyplax serrata]|uniref:Uncharacterized protein n=1 Tax=Polyplax serrata TaxID=468196 RepID=A0AAN8S1X7_POLSC
MVVGKKATLGNSKKLVRRLRNTKFSAWFSLPRAGSSSSRITTETGETGAAKDEGERVTGEEKKEKIFTFGEPGKSGVSTSKAQQQTKRAGEERSFFRAEGMAVQMRDFCVAKPTNRNFQ